MIVAGVKSVDGASGAQSLVFDETKATLRNLNPKLGRWYVLTLDVEKQQQNFHLE